MPKEINDNFILIQIQELEQQLIALDYERNEIISQIDKLKKQQKTVREIQKNTLTSEEKVALFRSLFRGREDTYAKRWQNE